MRFTPSQPLPSLTVRRIGAAALLLSVAAAGCRNSQSAGGAAAAAPPPSAVKVITLEQKPVEQASEFIATIRSLRSTTVQPEVDGLITRIFVKSGDHVRAGTPLVQINADKQQATVNSTEANRAGTEADVQYWRQQVKRLESLVAAGAISRQEFDQAQNSLRTAEARLAALDAQVREGRVELQFYRVNAPQAGVIGDIPVRTGDRVTTSTVITTIDENAALEAYIQVPLDRSPDLRVGSARCSCSTRTASRSPPTPSPSSRRASTTRTQTVLVKSALRNAPPSLRVQQFVRARIVWQQHARPDGTGHRRDPHQRPVFLLRGRAGARTAWSRASGRCRSVSWSATTTSSLGGLKAGDKVIVSGIQKIGDGAPIKPE